MTRRREILTTLSRVASSHTDPTKRTFQLSTPCCDCDCDVIVFLPNIWLSCIILTMVYEVPPTFSSSPSSLPSSSLPSYISHSRILNLLVPVKLLQGKAPSQKCLEYVPHLAPIADAVCSGNVRALDARFVTSLDAR